MKKLFFMAVLLMLSLSAAPQDYYSDNSEYELVADDNNPDDYVYDIDDGVDLTGEQWHTNDASILAANNSQYIVVRGPTRSRYILGRLDVPAYERVFGYGISSYRPYYYNGSLGWYVLAGLINYFIYPDGRWCRLGYAPYYYPYRYHIAHCHRINFYDWHFWHGRHHHSYRGTCYYNHRQGSHYYRRSQAPSLRNDYRSSSSRSTNRVSSAVRSERVNSTRGSNYRQTSSRRSSGYTNAPDYRKGPDSGTYSRSQASGSRSTSSYSRTSSNSSRSSSYSRPSGSSYTRSSSGSSRSSYSRSSGSSSRSSGTSSRSSSGSSHRR